MQAQFITTREYITHPCFVKTFKAENVKKAVLSITGLGLYRAFINGVRAGEDYLTPGFNDYDVYLRYQVYDVTDCVKEDNTIEVYTGNGWYRGEFGWGNKFDRWGDKYYLCAELELTYADGSKETIATDDSWKAHSTVWTDSGIYNGEYRDDTLPCNKVTDCVVTDRKFNLTEQFSPAVKCKATLKPTLINTPKGEQVLDFGQNMAGTFRFVNRTPRGTRIYIQTGEVMQKGCFYHDNYRDSKSEFVYISDGTEKIVEPMFTFYGFRYLLVEGIEKVDPADFTALVLSSGLKEVMQVETGHALINRLMLNSLWGQRSNFIDVPTDCPQRDERLGWTGDTQAFSDTACYQMYCKEFYDKFMRDLRADQTLYYDGEIPCFTPSCKKSCREGGAVWSDSATIVPMNVYNHYGDKDLLRKNYPMMRDYAEKLIWKDERDGGTHLVFTSPTYGDWLAMDGLTPQHCWGGTEPAYIQAVYYMQSLELTAQAAGILGYEDDEKKYSSLAAEVKQAMLDEYITAGGNLSVNTQTGYVLALRHGLYRDKEKLLKGFRTRLSKDFYGIMTGFTGCPILLPVLFENGMADVAYRMLLNEGFPGWLYCVKLGATTIWERWNSLNPDGSISGTDMNSLNHYAYGSVCTGIYEYMCGLKRANPGFTKAIIAPNPDIRLGHASIAHQSAAGEWKVSWNIADDNTFTMNVTVPEGAEADITLPFHPENAHFTAGSGTYNYTYMPTRDYHHPFGNESLVLDLLRNDDTVKLLREFLNDEMYTKLTCGQKEEHMIYTAEAFAKKKMGAKAPAFLEKLKLVRV